MKRINGWMVFILIIASLLLSACGGNAAEIPVTGAEEEGPVKVEHLEGAQPTRLTLTEDAAKRLDIQTATVLDTQDNGVQRMVVPYAAILYDTQGNTWVYTNPEPLIFVRTPIIVDHIERDQAFLSAGPPSGIAVVTVGVAELFGSETEFEEE
jgi:hypothetical protein